MTRTCGKLRVENGGVREKIMDLRLDVSYVPVRERVLRCDRMAYITNSLDFYLTSHESYRQSVTAKNI